MFEKHRPDRDDESLFISISCKFIDCETTPPRRHTQVGVGRINGCGHPWTPGARADFKTCADAERSDTVVTLPLTLRAAVDAPMWIACDMGCCEFVQ